MTTVDNSSASHSFGATTPPKYFTYGGPDSSSTDGYNGPSRLRGTKPLPTNPPVQLNGDASDPASETGPIKASASHLRDVPASVGVRQDLRNFFYPPAGLMDRKAALQRRDLFILAFACWESLPKEDPDSYIQLAAVHGRPMSVGYGFDAPPTEMDTDDTFNPLVKLKYVDRSGPGDGPVQFSNMGVSEFAYCKHGRPTFMTWHRPYMYLVERALRRCALSLIENRLLRGDIEAAKVQAPLLCFPYWNWGITAPVPDVLLCETIELTQFSVDGLGASTDSSDPDVRSGLPHRSTIPNPFRRFNPTKQQFLYFNGEVPDPEQYMAPQGVSGTLTDLFQNCVFDPHGTLRQPGWSSYLSSFLVRDLRRNLSRGFQVKDFVHSSGEMQLSGEYWLESAHNALHNAFALAHAPDFGMPTTTQAPSKADMTGTPKLNNVAVIVGRSAMINDMSTMDPAFWFHHAFVDCQLAMQRHAYPTGDYLPPITLPDKRDPTKSYYPKEDPVPVSDDLLPGQTRAWMNSACHPWTTGLFTELFGGDSVSEEREKKKTALAADPPQVYSPTYVVSGDVEHCETWGYTYDMLLQDKCIQAGVVELPTADRSPWLTPEQAQEKFIFNYTEDPFLKTVIKLRPSYPDKFPWNHVKADDLAQLKKTATNARWRLCLSLPKFFKIDDGFAVGRSYTLNVFFTFGMTDKEVEELRKFPTPTSAAYAGSAAVFSPFNLRQCLNCQKDNTSWPVAVDLTEVLIERNATHLSKEDILKYILLDPTGIPRKFLPKEDEWIEDWLATVEIDEQPRPLGDSQLLPVVLWDWKKMLSDGLARMFSTASHSAALNRSKGTESEPIPSPLHEAAVSMWHTWKREDKDRINRLLQAIDHRGLS